ncbi:MAG: hypothetical protein VYE15_02015 [Myxococcota bacterium]|nr:hypothetical protein [Myxococcota bacterium]
MAAALAVSTACTVVSLVPEGDDDDAGDASGETNPPPDVISLADTSTITPDNGNAGDASTAPESDASDADESDVAPSPGDAQGSDDIAPDASTDAVDDVACVPNCLNKECVIDGCGGECGTCDGANTECKLGKCQEIAGCQPDCEGKVCGPDGCGGQCGDCVFPGDLTDDLEAEIVIRRQAAELGVALGEQQITEEIQSTVQTLVNDGLLGDANYSGINTSTVLTGPEMEGNVDYVVFPCQYLGNGFNEPPTTCDALVLLAKNDAFQKLSTLTNPSTLPVAIQESPYAGKAQLDYTNGYGTGVRRAAELHRWALREQGVCDRFFEPVTNKEKPLPVVEAYWKGIVVGMQYYAEVLNNWIGVYGYSDADWPEDISSIDLCNLNENLVAEAGAEAELGYLAYAEAQSLCGATYNPPATPEVQAGYADAVQAFYDGAEDGWQSEFTFSSMALWESLGCVPSIPTY